MPGLISNSWTPYNPSAVANEIARQVNAAGEGHYTVDAMTDPMGASMIKIGYDGKLKHDLLSYSGLKISLDGIITPLLRYYGADLKPMNAAAQNKTGWPRMYIVIPGGAPVTSGVESGAITLPDLPFVTINDTDLATDGLKEARRVRRNTGIITGVTGLLLGTIFGKYVLGKKNKSKR